MRIVLYPSFFQKALAVFQKNSETHAFQDIPKKERVMFVEMETVKLSAIVMKWHPEMMPFLKQDELDSTIVLRDGLGILESADAMDIIQYSICEHQDPAFLQ